jgi:hypothetical protein
MSDREKDSPGTGELKELVRTWDLAEADVIKSFLESQGIPCLIRGESIASLYRLMTDGMGEIQIMVPAEHLETARKLIEEKVEIPENE